MREYLDIYIKELEQQGFRNLRITKQCLVKLFKYQQEYKLKLKELTADDYLDWLHAISMKNGRKYKPYTIRQIIHESIRFYDFLQDRGIVSGNPLQKFKPVKKTKPVNARWGKLLAGFENWLVLKGRRQRTLDEYKMGITKLFNYLEETDLEFAEVNITEAQAFQGWLIDQGNLKQGGYTDGTIAYYVKVAGSFFDYLKHGKQVYSNPFKEIRKVKEKKKLPKNVLKENEMHKLLQTLAAFDDEDLRASKHKYRMHVVAELMYSTGMRINEASNIQLADIDFNAGTILLRETKDKKEHTVFLNDYAKEVLELYVKEMRPVILSVKADKKKLFGCSTRVLKHLFNQELKRACSKAGLAPISSKGFRHAFGYHFLRAGCDMRYIQALLGHSQLTSTEKYTKVDKEDLRNIIDKFHPRKWRIKR